MSYRSLEVMGVDDFDRSTGELALDLQEFFGNVLLDRDLRSMLADLAQIGAGVAIEALCEVLERDTGTQLRLRPRSKGERKSV